MPPKRALKPTLSEATEAILGTEASERSKRRRVAALRQISCHVPVERTTTAFALNQWDRPHHLGLFVLTILVRAVVAVVPELRDNGNWFLWIGSRRVEQSFIFRPMLEDGTICFRTAEFHALTECMRRMHVHFPTAEGDAIHKLVSNIVTDVSLSLERQVWFTSFYLEFAFLGRWLGTEELREVSTFSASNFAAFCWNRRILPVTPRHGQGVQKAIHSKLKLLAADHNQKGFTDLLHQYWRDRLLTADETREIALCLNCDGNRISAIHRVLNNKHGFGCFSAKNLIEALAAHGLLRNVRAEEWGALKNGPSAQRYFTAVGVSRTDVLAYVQSVFAKMSAQDNIRVQIQGQDRMHIPYTSLNLPMCCFTERLVQYWACAQGRILTIHQNISRRMANPIPYHLLPNSEVKSVISRAFGGETFAEDEASDE